MMTQTNPCAPENPTAVSTPPEAGAAAGEAVTVETRFGAITFDASNTIYLPRGIIGFPQFRRFGLAAIPDPRMGQFKLLQSLERTDLSFLVLPVHLDGQTILDTDVDEACATVGVHREDAAFLLLVTLRKEDEGISVSTNVRAPIILDTSSQVARQYVLPNTDYPIRQTL